MTIYLKKKYVLLLFSIALLGCSEEIYKNNLDEQEISSSLTIEKAKDWYASNFPLSKTQNLLKIKSSDSTLLKLKPLLNWDLAELDNDSIWSTVELPWEFENGKVTMANSEVSRYSENNQTQIEQVLRLVILKNRKTGNIYGFKMAVIPDLEYMLKKGTGISSNNYFNRDADLSGVIMFYSVNDEFVNGWKYSRGKIIGKVSNVEPKSSSKVFRILSIDAIQIQTCVDYRVESAGAATTYGTDCYESIYYVSSSGSGSGSGSTTSGGYNTSYGGGGSSGNAGNTVDEPGIASKMSLNKAGIYIFNNALNELLKQCGYSAMYDYLTGMNLGFNNVYIDPAGSTGGYHYETGDLTFSSNSAITGGLAEEFIHLFQDHYYSGGMASYIHNANFEFEAKVIQDLECMIKSGFCPYYGDPDSNSQNYTKWMYTVTKNNTYFPSYEDLLIRYPACNNMNYSDFLNAFSTNPAKPQYNLPVIPTLTPQVISFIKNNSCN